MMFTKGYWTNKHFMDVFFEIQKVQYVDGKRAKVRGVWWNLGYNGNPWLIPVNPQTLVIKAEHFRDWKRLYDPIRYVPEAK